MTIKIGDKVKCICRSIYGESCGVEGSVYFVGNDYCILKDGKRLELNETKLLRYNYLVVGKQNHIIKQVLVIAASTVQRAYHVACRHHPGLKWSITRIDDDDPNKTILVNYKSDE